MGRQITTLFLFFLLAGTVARGAALPGFEVVRIASAKGFVTSVVVDSSDTIFYSTTVGGVYRLDGSDSVELAKVPTAASGNEALLGMAFLAEGELVVHYVLEDHTADVIGRLNLADGTLTDLARFPCDRGRVCPDEHHGGNPTVGADGAVYVAIGDFGGGVVAQDPSSPGGKIWRIAAGEAEMFAMGFRNPFDLAFDPVSGKIVMTDNGPVGLDELNFVSRGDNCGWPATMGDQPAVPGMHPPAYTFAQTIAPTGLALLNGRGPMPAGGAVIASFVTRALYYFPDLTARPLPDPIVLIEKETGPIIDVVQTSTGGLILGAASGIYRLEFPKPGDADGDGRLTDADLTSLAREILDGDGTRVISAQEGGYRGSWGADVNRDGTIDARDLVALVRLPRQRNRPAR